MSVRVLIVDDHGILREGLRLLIERHGGMEIVGEARDGREAISEAVRTRPHVVLMDVSMPNLNGIGATMAILEECPQTRVLALSAHADRRFVKDMLTAGARGYVLKDTASDNLLDAIETVLKGDVYLCPRIAGLVVQECVDLWESDTDSRTPPAGGQDTSFASLTAKDRELMQLLAEGKSNKEAALVLNLSVKTVDARRRSIMGKLGVSSVAELTKIAIREGLTSVDF